ncbi:AAA family ATPase [Asticcacaulis sp.]|uniref:AAA family ATPase n=1 Tax=Asticcacaulis sp. TaxID=1872648 RepID=UPI002601C7A7|nr:AAA family ATPase [Asticcacaulis sp.]
MTRYDPSILLNRLVVYKEDRIVYDERFKVGVNVIRGENSSGKSTILNLIYFALGGELADWSDHALMCTRVMAEVQFNGKLATLSRDISDQRQRPMDIFGGPYLDSIIAPRESWIRCSYTRSSKESFSQVLYRLLGLPEVANETSGNLTIHQIYRLLYSDQLSATGSIFKHDPVYDNPLIRESVGRLLCGAYDQDIYHRRMRVRELEKQFEGVAGELRSIFSFLGSQTVTPAQIEQELVILKDEEKEVLATIQDLERAAYGEGEKDELSLTAYNEAFEAFRQEQLMVDSAQSEISQIELEIVDAAQFIASLEQKLEQLTDAKAMSEHLDGIRFHSCPACNTPLEVESVEHSCHLCKSPFDPDRARQRIVATINDVALQLKQSKEIQEDRGEELTAARKKLDDALVRWKRQAVLLQQLKTSPNSEATSKLRELQQRLGYLTRFEEDLSRKSQMANEIALKQDAKRRIGAEMESLRLANENAEQLQVSRMAEATHAISEEIKDLLKNDLPRQDSFRDPQRVDINFTDNKISVDGKIYFSASSRVILKNSFILGFLSAATKHRFFRHPRFCIIDTIEDKGMEEKRSWNFQVQVAKLSNDAPSSHQIIFATAMPSPEVEDFSVGKFSTLENPTLDLEAQTPVRRLSDHARVWNFVQGWLLANVVRLAHPNDSVEVSKALDRARTNLTSDAFNADIDQVMLEGIVGNVEDVIAEYYQSLGD